MKMKVKCVVCNTSDPYKCDCDKCELCLEKPENCTCNPEEKRRHYDI
jgi:hypothetical protein